MEINNQSQKKSIDEIVLEDWIKCAAAGIISVDEARFYLLKGLITLQSFKRMFPNEKNIEPDKSKRFLLTLDDIKSISASGASIELHLIQNQKKFLPSWLQTKK